MNQEDLIRKLADQLSQIQSQVELLLNSTRSISEIETDLLLQKMRDAYTEMKALQVTIHPAEYMKTEAQKRITITEEKTETHAEPVNETKQTTIEEKQSQKRVQPYGNQSRSPDLFDTPRLPEETLLEKLSKQKDDKSLADKLSSTPVSDLKKSIGINERFKFINELFESNTSEYNHFIEQLNACSTSDEALNLMETEYVAKLGWSKEEETYQSLVTLVSRKFS
ncbi:MAG: hypothetical protein LC117_08670 [Bacteroidia bacterium]|nr:hypothetical protein [Bacteroidia bacterium]MCZ2277985.1 hypothetical protein [Bacteroidia bacterium]